MRQIDQNAAENVNRILIANKSDLNTNVDEAFMAIAKDIVDRLKENPEHYGSTGGQAIFVNDAAKKKEKSSCC
eukprot:gene27524-36318_t